MSGTVGSATTKVFSLAPSVMTDDPLFRVFFAVVLCGVFVGLPYYATCIYLCRKYSRLECALEHLSDRLERIKGGK